jgi:hypothetical protein
MIHECNEPGCAVLTMGAFCVEHEQALTRNEVSLLEALTPTAIPAVDPAFVLGATAA